MQQTACPTCGSPLQATLVQYRSNIALDEDGRVSHHDAAPENDADGYAWDHPTCNIYCTNDHPIDNWLPPRDAHAAWLQPDLNALLETPCIAVDLFPTRTFLVDAYNTEQRLREFQPLWARRVPPVEALTNEPATWGARITDPAAYQAQMRVLLGLDPTRSSEPTRC